MIRIKNYKASAIVSTIIILSVVLTTVLSLILVSNIGRNVSSSSNESLVAYQRADMGVEKTLAAIVKGYSAPNNLSTPVTSGSWDDVGVCDASSGKIKKDNLYTIQLMKRINPVTSPDLENVACNKAGLKFSEIILVKAVGIVPGKTQRAISAVVPVPVAP
ncbi:MAG: hypothetical protein ACD_15C00204G0006 [uncultured bacterium]|nr:MAG: hypothetical protein ACD_15C00204G0006 [uncultured bacterium]HCU70250.1 hypothetical protein [Candidatus Moranbacteria bacterium]